MPFINVIIKQINIKKLKKNDPLIIKKSTIGIRTN